ncbi:MAG: hypothetical protein RLZZ312_275 [Bacteroidota bacterium]
MRMKKITILITIFFWAQLLFAQSDSISFKNIKVCQTQIQKGVLLKTMVFKDKNLFASNQNISIIEVTKANLFKFQIAFNKKILKTTSNFAIENNAIAAINGNFFDTKNGGAVDFLKINGLVINQNQLTNEFRNFHQKAAISINQGEISIVKYNHFDNWERNIDIKNIMVSGPHLIFNNNLEFIDESPFNKNRHPRSVLAITKANHVLMITVDGRHSNASGMSLFEVQKILKWLHVKHAINLDGGGSTALFVAAKLPNGIVNYPSDNKTWDHFGERKVANIIYLIEKKVMRHTSTAARLRSL